MAEFNGLTNLFSSQLDNESNEMMARWISNSQEFFIRYMLQCILVLVLWQFHVSPDKIIKAFHQMVTSGVKTKFKVRQKLGVYFM